MIGVIIFKKTATVIDINLRNTKKLSQFLALAVNPDIFAIFIHKIYIKIPHKNDDKNINFN